MYGEESNPTGIDSRSIYMVAAQPQAMDEWFNPIQAAQNFYNGPIKTIANSTPEQRQRAAKRFHNAVSTDIKTLGQNASTLATKAGEGLKAATTAVGDTVADIGGHIAGTGINTAIGTAKNTASTVMDKNGKAVGLAAAGALGLYGAHNLVQHLRKNAESDRAIRKQLDANKELLRYKESVRQEMKQREAIARNMSKEEIAAVKDRERKEVLKLQSLAHQADVEGRNMIMTGYNPYIKESAVSAIKGLPGKIGGAVKKFNSEVEPTYGNEETYTDSKNPNVSHKRKYVTIGDKTYIQIDDSKTLTPAKDGTAKISIDDAKKQATHDRNVKRASTALSVGVPLTLMAAGVAKHHFDEKKKRKEEEERKRKEAEDAYNSRIDVRVRKALGKKKEPTNEAYIYDSVATRYSPDDSMDSILEDAVRVQRDYVNNHRNAAGGIAAEYAPPPVVSPWMSQGGI